MEFEGKSTVEAAPSTRKTGRGLEIALAVGLVLAAVVPLAADGPKPPADHHSSDFRTIATQLINASAVDPAMRVRRNAKEMSARERRQFVEAVLELKRRPSPYTPGLSYYDQFVQWHNDMYVCKPGLHTAGIDHDMTMAHGSPLFLPWHRVYLRLFEDALRHVSGKPITVPYWDWSDPEATKSVFRDDLMGGPGDRTANFSVSGPFNAKDWKLNVHPKGAMWAPSASDFITRNLTDDDGDGDYDGLPTAAQVADILKLDQYDAPPYNTTTALDKSFRTNLEGFRGDPYPEMVCGPDGWMAIVPSAQGNMLMHNLVHESTGGVLLISSASLTGAKVFGTMTLPTAPNDPVFFLHHSNIDRLWAQWQQLHPGAVYQPQQGYPGLNGTDLMGPWNVTPNSVEDIKKLGYRYE